MDWDDKFRRNAAAAQRKADGAVSQVDKEAWLRVAQGWLDLIRRPVRGAEQQGDEGGT